MGGMKLREQGYLSIGTTIQTRFGTCKGDRHTTHVRRSLGQGHCCFLES
jgi:hypothetical protein